jgi:regulatory protein
VARAVETDGYAAGGSAADIPGDPEQPLGDPESAARIICLRLLERRARSRAELADALRRRGIPDDAATAVLDRFREVGLIDDVALARTVAAAQHAERGLARRAIAANLRKRGLSDEVVGDALTEIDTDGEQRRAGELVRRRRRAIAHLPIETQVRRLVGLLARKGYPAGLAYQVVRDELAVLPEAAGALDPPALE